MKILIVSQYFWPENFRINDLAQGLKEKGHSITVLTGIPNYPEGKFYSGYGIFKTREEFNGISIIRIPIIPRGKGNGLRLIVNYLSYVFFACMLGPFYIRNNFDLIFVPQYSPVTVCLPAILLKKVNNKPLLMWIQDLWPETLEAMGIIKSSFVMKMIHKVVKFIYQHSELILVQSRSFIKSVLLKDIPKNKILYFPNWAEELYRPLILPEDAPERRILPSGFCVMFAGNIGIGQDFGTILDAAEKLKNYSDLHWVVLGDGSMKSWVEKEISKRCLDRTFHLIGRFPLEAMPRFFSLADCLLVTLKKDSIFSFTIPGKIQSYLAVGKPIVAAIDGEGKRVIEESKAGLTGEAEDSNVLATNVLEMYKISVQELVQMGKNGRNYYEMNFERNKLIEELEKSMEQCVSKHKRRMSL